MFVWGYALGWFLVNDRVKLLAYRFFDPVKVEPKLAAKAEPKPGELKREAGAKTLSNSRPQLMNVAATSPRMNRRAHVTSTTERKKMKINSKDFRVLEGDKVNLKKWPQQVVFSKFAIRAQSQ